MLALILGMVCSACSICSISCSLVTFLFHSVRGFRSMKTSTILIGLGSVPSSGRPACDIAEITSGNCRMIARMRAHIFDVSLTEIPGGKVRLTQKVPSFSSGRNSVPKSGTSPHPSTIREKLRHYALSGRSAKVPTLSCTFQRTSLFRPNLLHNPSSLLESLKKTLSDSPRYSAPANQPALRPRYKPWVRRYVLRGAAR